MSDKPVVVAIHGVGDSDPGAIVRSLAAHFGPAVYERRELLIGEASYPAAIAAGKRVVAEVPGGAEPERLPDLFEVNWADVRKPKNNITGVVRHLFRLMLAMLYLGERWHYGRESPSRAAALYRWAVEGLLVWGTVYALVTRLMHAAGGGLAVVYGLVGAVGAVLVGLWFRSSSRAFFVSSCIAAAALLLNTAWLAWPGASTSDAVWLSTLLVGVGANLIAASLAVAFFVNLYSGLRAGQRPWQVLTRAAALYIPLLVLGVAGSLVWVVNPELLGKTVPVAGTLPTDEYRLQRDYWSGRLDGSGRPRAGPDERPADKAKRYGGLYQRERRQAKRRAEQRKLQVETLKATRFHPFSTQVSLSLMLGVIGLVVLCAGVHYFVRRELDGGARARGWLRAILVVCPVLLIAVGGLMVYEVSRTPSPEGGEEIWLSIWDAGSLDVRRLFDNLYARLATLALALLLPIGLVVSDILGDIVFFVTPDRDRKSSGKGAGGWERSIRGEVCRRFEVLIESLASRRAGGIILVLAHSQGSVVVADVLPELLEERPELAQRIRLITLGSPLHTLYFKLFGLFEEIAIPPECRWMNLYRSGDYIGGAISAESCKENRPIGSGGHTHYWSNARVHQAIDEQLGRSAPAERAGGGS